MQPEHALDNAIRAWCGQHNWLCFHANVGKVKVATSDGRGRIFDTGLPVGFPDLLILTDDNKTIFCETKIHPRKPTNDQLHFIANLRSRGFTAFVAYTLDEFIAHVTPFLRTLP